MSAAREIGPWFAGDSLTLQIHWAEALLELPRLAEQCDEQEFLQRALAFLEDLTQSQISFVHFVNDDEQSIELITWSKRTLAFYCHAAYDKHYPVAQAGIWADALRQKKPVIFNDYATYQHKRGLPEGHAHLARLISSPVMNEGKVVMITGVGNKASNYTETDVALVQLVSNEIWNLAKRRRVLTDLAHKEQLFRATFEQAAVGLAQVSPQGDFLQINQRFCQIVGYSVSELLTLTLQQIIHPEDLADDLLQIGKLLQDSSQSYIKEKRYIRQDGSIVWVNVSISWVCQGDQPGYLIVAIEDISQRKQAEFQLEEINQNLEDLVEQRTAALLEREARYRALMDQASDAIILADLQGVCLETNQQAENLLGYTQQELRGMPLKQIYLPEELPRVQSYFNQLAHQAYIPTFSVNFVTKTGRIVPVDISASVIELQGEKIIQSIARDISDRLRYQEELNQKNQELAGLLTLREEALQLREDMSNMIVHDLRNPLSTILLATTAIQKALQKENTEALIHRKTEQILYSGKQLQRLIDSLLMMAKLESGKLLFNPVPTNLYHLGLETRKDFDLLLKANQITLKTILPDPAIHLTLDTVILRRILDNLLSNALKFSPPGGEVTLVLEVLPDNHLRIQVKDQGTGIKPEQAEEIFKKFEIGSIKPNVSQIGLGLAFCKLAVEAQGGTLTVMPNDPQGSIFTVEI